LRAHLIKGLLRAVPAAHVSTETESFMELLAGPINSGTLS
jgi:hypothetical protein